jgi:ribosomal protein uS2
MTEQALLVAQDQYLKAGIHIGTKYMEPFIYKTRPDGLSVLNLQKIDERLRTAAKLLSQYSPQDILVVSRRENGWKAVKAFGKHTGVKTFAGRYPPGVLTNSSRDTFMEVKCILVTDAWPEQGQEVARIVVLHPCTRISPQSQRPRRRTRTAVHARRIHGRINLIFYLFYSE